MTIVSSFTGGACLGNEHVVLLFERRLSCSDGFFERIAAMAFPRIAVFLWPSENKRFHHVRFFQGAMTTSRIRYGSQDKAGKAESAATPAIVAREVRRCGSGSLAAAQVLDNAALYDGGHFELASPAGWITVGKNNRQFFYQTRVLPIKDIGKDKKTSAWLDKKIENVALVGNDSQYIIVELKDEKQVKLVSISVGRVCRFTRRALIVTAKSQRASDDYVMRYFAPQYGRIEDAATGSANAMLAAYWQQRLRKKCIRGRQLSPQGGTFCVAKIGLEQRVLGHCRQLPADANLYKRITDLVSDR